MVPIYMLKVYLMWTEERREDYVNDGIGSGSSGNGAGGTVVKTGVLRQTDVESE